MDLAVLCLESDKWIGLHQGAFIEITRLGIKYRSLKPFSHIVQDRVAAVDKNRSTGGFQVLIKFRFGPQHPINITKAFQMGLTYIGNQPVAWRSDLTEFADV